MSKTEFARRLSMDRSTIHRWEAGQYRPEHPDIARSFAELFGLDIDEALVAAGFKPTSNTKPAPTPTREPPLDPDVRIILRRLADPNVSNEEKTNIRAMLRYLANLADQAAQRPAKKSQPRRRKAD